LKVPRSKSYLIL